MFRSFLARNEGAAFVLVAFAIMALTGAVGTAVDVGRGQMVRAKLQNALDAAGLAAGASPSSDMTVLNAIIAKYMNINFSGGTLGATITSTPASLSENKMVLTVDAYAQIPTTVMKVFGRETMNLHAKTEVTRTNKGLELALVLDVTGSMCQPCDKLVALKTAANDLIDILFGTNTVGTNLWIGVVPFSQAVNVGNTHDNWIDPIQDHNNLDWGPGGDWGGCVEARYDANDVTVATPGTEKFQAYYWPDDGNNNWITTDIDTDSEYICYNKSSCKCSNYSCGCTTKGDTTTCIDCSGSGSGRDCEETTTVTTTNYTITSSKGPNRYCPTQLTPLTNVKATLTSAITALTTNGMTHVPVGAIWGWRLLDPNWKTWWGGSMETNNLPLAYNTPLMIKAVVIMTDGTNTMIPSWNGAYGYLSEGHLGTTDEDDAEDELDDRLTTVCNSMKAQGILVYTVLFQEDDNGIKTMLQNCATVPDYFFDTDTGADLQSAFQTIGASLANLRISK